MGLPGAICGISMGSGRVCAGAIVALAGCQQDRERPFLAVTGGMGFGGRPSSGSAEDRIIFLRPELNLVPCRM